MHDSKLSIRRLLLGASLAVALPFAALAAPPDMPAGGPGFGHEHDHCGPAMHGAMHPGMHEEGGPMGHLLRHLKLSEAQQDKVFAIYHAQAPQLRELAKTVRKSHEELREIGFSGNYDEAKARSAADAGAKAMADMALLKARSEQQIYAILTPEQRKEADDLRKRFEERREHEHGGPGPMEPRRS